VPLVAAVLSTAMSCLIGEARPFRTTPIHAGHEMTEHPSLVVRLARPPAASKPAIPSPAWPGRLTGASSGHRITCQVAIRALSAPTPRDIVMKRVAALVGYERWSCKIRVGLGGLGAGCPISNVHPPIPGSLSPGPWGVEEECHWASQGPRCDRVSTHMASGFETQTTAAAAKRLRRQPLEMAATNTAHRAALLQGPASWCHRPRRGAGSSSTPRVHVL
jgi:hypothetical protein